jgi:hypothetical protein
MNMLTILVVVLVQIAVFQFASVFLARGAPALLVGDRDLPAELARRMDRFRRSSGRSRMALGGLLAAAALLAGLIRPAGPGEGKLILAAISLVSTAGMIGGYLRDRRAIRSMQDLKLDSGLRLASLEPRTIRRYYHPAWEALPVVVLVASAAFTVWAVSREGVVANGDSAGLHMIAILALQGFLVVGLLVFTSNSVLASASLAARLPVFRESPEAAIALDNALRETELRYFLAAKVGVVLLLALRLGEIAAEALHNPSRAWLEAGGWALVTALLVLFGFYVHRVVKLSRKVVNAAGADRQPAGS